MVSSYKRLFNVHFYYFCEVKVPTSLFQTLWSCLCKWTISIENAFILLFLKDIVTCQGGKAQLDKMNDG